MQTSTLSFIIGEKKNFYCKVKRHKLESDEYDENFIISTAKVELYKDNVLLYELPKEIRDKYIFVTLDSSKLSAGKYVVKITYSINDEIMIGKVKVTVRE